MAKRVYKLPKIDQLTKDQRKVFRLDDEGQYLIVGAPGTGKSVVALLRARKIFNEHNESLFLTFNHVLKVATIQLMEPGLECDTAMSWFYQSYWTLTGGKAESFHQDKMPEIEAHKPDYIKVEQKYNEMDLDYSNYQLIIDEGQDLPPGWYESVLSMGFENIFIVADQNQQITDDHSSRIQLEESIGIDGEEVIILKENWRNTTPIAKFCNSFYTDKSSTLPDLPNRPSTNIPILYEYENRAVISKMILKEFDRDPSKLIGFIVPNESKREFYAKELRHDLIVRQNERPIISTYSSNLNGQIDIDFTQGGIVVLCDKSVKGIEFDSVYIIIDDFKMGNIDAEMLKKRFYVMTSRARERLYMFKSAIRKSIVEDILPPEENMFKRTKI